MDQLISTFKNIRLILNSNHSSIPAQNQLQGLQRMSTSNYKLDDVYKRKLRNRTRPKSAPYLTRSELNDRANFPRSVTFAKHEKLTGRFHSLVTDELDAKKNVTILVKASAFVPDNAKTKLDPIPSDTSEQVSVRKSGRITDEERRSIYWNKNATIRPKPVPSTTYKSSNFKPYPYDNISMFKPRLNYIAEEDYHSTDQELLPVQEHRSIGPLLSNDARSYHNYLPNTFSRTTRVLYQTSINLPAPSQSIVNYGGFVTGGNDSTFGLPVSHSNSQVPPKFSGLAMGQGYKEFFRQKSTTSTNSVDDPRNLIRELRRWNYTSFGKSIDDGMQTVQSFGGGGTRFTLMNYNILSQQLLKQNQGLYKNCDPEALPWSVRFRTFLKEVEEYGPDIICLQEVDELEFKNSFEASLFKAGFRGIYKKRTRGKKDGCAIFWNKDMFSFVQKLELEYCQPKVPLLNRDNVALMVKLETRFSRVPQKFVVATTHLLYNPKRDDIRLAQVHLLLAELDRFCFKGYENNTCSSPTYLPVLLCGDFNCQSHTSPIELLVEGTYSYGHEAINNPKYDKLGRNTMENFPYKEIGISDNCSHYKLQLERIKQWKSHRKPSFDVDRVKQEQLINLDAQEARFKSPSKGKKPKKSNNKASESKIEIIDLTEDDHEEILEKLNEECGMDCSFGTGTLSHNFRFRSVNQCQTDNRDSFATTYHNSWVCVDYIFQGLERSSQGNRVEGNLKLIRHLGLLTRQQCKEIGNIPNFASPSDHYPLVAEFLLK